MHDKINDNMENERKLRKQITKMNSRWKFFNWFFSDNCITLYYISHFILSNTCIIYNINKRAVISYYFWWKLLRLCVWLKTIVENHIWKALKRFKSRIGDDQQHYFLIFDWFYCRFHLVFNSFYAHFRTLFHKICENISLTI